MGSVLPFHQRVVKEGVSEFLWLFIKPNVLDTTFDFILISNHIEYMY